MNLHFLASKFLPCLFHKSVWQLNEIISWNCFNNGESSMNISRNADIFNQSPHNCLTGLASSLQRGPACVHDAPDNPPTSVPTSWVVFSPESIGFGPKAHSLPQLDFFYDFNCTECKLIKQESEKSGVFMKTKSNSLERWNKNNPSPKIKLATLLTMR